VFKLGIGEGFREEVLGEFRFIEFREAEVERPLTLVFAYPDTGLVSVISSSYIINELKLVEFGGIESPALSHIVVVHDGVPKSSIRLYAGKNLIVVFSDIVLSPNLQVSLASALVDYVRLRGIDYIVCPTGIPVPNRLDVDTLKTYYVASSKKLAELAEKGGATVLKQGILVGAYATLLRESIKKNVNTLVLLTESFLDFPDPEAAAKGLQVFSKIVNRDIDVSKLLEEAELIKVKTRELMRQTKGVMGQMRKGIEYAPYLYV
jgi:uncharacterized protein